MDWEELKNDAYHLEDDQWIQKYDIKNSRIIEATRYFSSENSAFCQEVSNLETGGLNVNDFKAFCRIFLLGQNFALTQEEQEEINPSPLQLCGSYTNEKMGGTYTQICCYSTDQSIYVTFGYIKDILYGGHTYFTDPKMPEYQFDPIEMILISGHEEQRHAIDDTQGNVKFGTHKSHDSIIQGHCTPEQAKEYISDPAERAVIPYKEELIRNLRSTSR
ncbi:MAG: hypothetical protein ACK59C_07805 [Holosporales bacterium]|jgi:hypothetical protein